ncbi:MAG: efflux RND transporter periplasmic adaptor subunit [Treponema sp.]|nr:efflux RND transporter periplasmic adaptor subunit [Treponema sp.]
MIIKFVRHKTPYYSAALVLFAAILSCSCSNNKNGTASYEFTNIRRGTLERTVSSSGTINPVATVKVLPRMSGKVERVRVDYNDTVHRGDILAELNTDVLRLQREQMNSSVLKARANYELQLLNYRNQEALAEKGLISEYELRTSKTNLDNQAADLAVAESNLKVIETEINQYAYITSPIDGIVLDRNINVGDTVVDGSGSNSTSIFVIAENMREMQIEANVGELDVASIHRGQQVRFTLESLPGRRFTGVVENLRMVPVISNSMVSYTVIINVENQDGTLLPGMTCAVDFIVERSQDVLIIQNAALRYQPTSLSAEQISDMVFNASLVNMSNEQRVAAIEVRTQARTQSAEQGRTGTNNNTGITGLMMGQSGGARMMPAGGMGGGTAAGGRQSSGSGRQGQTAAAVMRNIWYIGQDGKLDVMQVQTGISDGTNTEILTLENIEGIQVIVRERI